MGHDATSTIPPGVPLEHVLEFLEILGFERFRGASRRNSTTLAVLRWWKEDHYRYYYGLWATVTKPPGGSLQVHTRANYFRTRADAELHNLILKQLRRRFQADFTSDHGTNRYFDVECWPDRSHAEGGCFLAVEDFGRSIERARIYLDHRSFAPGFPALPKEMQWIADGLNPALLSNSLLVPFLVAAFEEFCRQTFLALFTYSDRREAVLRNARISQEDLVSVLDGKMALADVCVRWFNFQDMPKITKAFQMLDHRLDLNAALSRPYRRRKQSLRDSVDALIERRHQIIHRNDIDSGYSDAALRRDIADLEAAVGRIYEHIATHFGWPHAARC